MAKNVPKITNICNVLIGFLNLRPFVGILVTGAYHSLVEEVLSFKLKSVAPKLIKN